MTLRIINLQTGEETTKDLTQEEIEVLKPSLEQIKKNRIEEIKSRLNQIDIVESIRPIRAIQAGVGTEFDTQKIKDLELEAETLREELRGLND